MTSWSELDALSCLRGQPYEAARDAILASKDVRTRAQAYMNDPAWERRVQASILLGWIEGEAAHRRTLHDINAEDPRAAAKGNLGMNAIYNAYASLAANKLKEAALPIAWEGALRSAEDTPPWKYIIFLRMIAAVPDPRSVDVLFAFMERAEGYDLRHAGSRALGMLPQGLIASRAKQEQKRYEELAKLLGDVVD